MEYFVPQFLLVVLDRLQWYVTVQLLDLAQWCVHFFSLFAQSFESVGWSAACTRLFCVVAFYFVYSKVPTIRLRSASHYSVLHLLTGVASAAFYMGLCQSHADILCLAFVDCMFLNSIIAVCIYSLISVWIGLHDWSVGLPLRLELAHAAITTLRRIIYFAVVARSFVYCASYATASAYYTDIISRAYVIVMYCWLGLFVRNNASMIQHEFKVYTEIATDDIMLNVAYAILAFLCILHITDIGVEDKLVQVALTSGVCAILFSIDVYTKRYISQISSMLKGVECDNRSIILWCVRIALAACGVVVTQVVWGIPLDFSDAVFRHWTTNIAIQLALVLFVADVMIVLFGVGMQRIMPHGKEFSVEGKKQRVATLFYSFRLVCNILRIVGCIVVVLTGFGVGLDRIVSCIGVSSALLAFVAKDACTNTLHGLLLIIEDAVNIGDLVEIDGVMGEVESIGLTFIRVRSIDGAVSFIQSGQIKCLKNRSRDFSYVIFNSALTPDTNIETFKLGITEIFTEIQSLAAKEGILLGKIEHRGLVDVTFHRVVYQLRIKCSPGKQFIIKRMINDRMPAMMHKYDLKIPAGHALFMEKSSASNSEYRLY